MIYRINLNPTNSKSLCLLPNGVQVLVIIQFRFFCEKWVIKLQDTNGNDLSDYVPLVYNTDLFGQYTYLKPIYGHFFVQQSNKKIDITEAINNTIVLCWRDDE